MVEIDLRREAEPRIIAHEPGAGRRHRLVLDIYPATRPATAATPASAPVPPPARVPAPATVSPPAPAPTPSPAAPAAPPATSAGDIAAADDYEELLLAVQINRQASPDTALLLRAADGRLLVARTDLERWRLRVPDAAPVQRLDETFYPLDTLRGLSYRMDESTMTLALEAGAGLFEGTALRGAAVGLVEPAPAPPGGFFNYDVFVDHEQGDTGASGLFELGAFGRYGVGVSSFLARDEGANLVRLDTTWTLDRPAQLASLRIGDAISAAPSFGGGVRFGGVQWATNFATQPTFITFPLPGLSGEAALPSTIDLYVNDALRLRREVPAGPFSIQDLPIVSGQGEARLVVRDLLGREQVITQPFYASPRLLQQGLTDYSYELGFVRENYGLISNDYGRFMAVGTHRRGVTDRFTSEIHAELLREQQTLGLGGVMLWPGLGVVSAAIAGSSSDRGTGATITLGFEHQARSVSFGANTQLATEEFVQLGLQPDQLAPRQRSQAFFSVATQRHGSFAINYTHQDFRDDDREDVELVGASYGVTLGRLGFLSVSAIGFLSGDEDTAIELNFTRQLGERTSASASVQPQRDEGLLQVQRYLPPGSGYGYRLQEGLGDSQRRLASVSAQNDVGTYLLEASQAAGETGIRGSVSGGVALVAGDVFLSRRINESFAVVEVADYPGVRIYADNQVAARTDDRGIALLPRLRPYQNNPVRIETADLPLDAQIDTVEMNAIPYFRSGLVLAFPIKRSLGALIAVVLENGQPLPAGATARIAGGSDEFPSGERGEIYLTGLAAANRLQVSWRGQSCEFTVLFPATDDPLPHLGNHTCTGVKL